MSDDEDELFIDPTQSHDDEWIIPEPCLNNNSLHWSEEGYLAVAARQTVFLVNPSAKGTEGLVGTVSLSNRDEKSLLSSYHVYERGTDTRLVEDLRSQNAVSVAAVAWSPSGLGTHVRYCDERV